MTRTVDDGRRSVSGKVGGVVLAAFIAMAGTWSGGAAQAAIINEDPGPRFDMPPPGVAYLWEIDLDGLATGDTLLDFIVDVPAPGRFLQTFQIFAQDDMDFYANLDVDFDLVVDQPDQPSWTSKWTSPYHYHNYLDVLLDAGPRSFTVTLASDPPADSYVNARFGDIIPAVPLPGGAVLLSAALGAMVLRRSFGG